MDYDDKSYYEPEEPVINNDPENGDYIIRWDNGYPVKVWL